MERHEQPDRQGYRTAARPDRVPFTVVRVRPGEYAEPEWLRRLRQRIGDLRDRLGK